MNSDVMAAESQGSPRVVSSSLNQRFQIVVPGGCGAHPSATPIDASCPDSVKRFIRFEFNTSDSLWRSIVRQHFPDISGNAMSSTDLYDLVSELIIRGKLRLYRLPSLEGALVTTNGLNKAYRFIKGPDPLPATDAKLMGFKSESDIDELMGAVKAGEQFWQSVLEENDGHSQASSMNNARSIVRKKLKSGELRAYEMDYRPAPPKSDGAQTEEAAGPGSRPAPLAPETTTSWVEIELLYDDGSVAADQKYWIKDCEGNEYNGTTDANGKAKLDQIPDGPCEISFPELDGWD